MLPYTPLHHLLFAAGAPDVLVMTSANRSSEPIAYLDADALRIARRNRRRVSRRRAADRAARRRFDRAVGAGGRVVLRRARGMAPAGRRDAPGAPPILALGGDLKNALTLVVDGQAFASQHVGDLEHLSSRAKLRSDGARSVRDVRGSERELPDRARRAPGLRIDGIRALAAGRRMCACSIIARTLRAC